MAACNADVADFANIMTHVDLGPWAESRCRLASALGDAFGARLIGVAAEQLVAPVYSDGFPNAGKEPAGEDRRRAGGDLAAARRMFESVVGSRNDVEWRSAFAHPERFLIEQARAADLIVVGRSATYDEPDPNLGVSCGTIAMECGRPVLVVPPEKDYLAARKVVVAWKDTREARRAVRDALPFLKRADEVHVMAVTGASRDESAEDVCAWLARHGVNARPSIHSGETGSIAEEVTDLSVETNADLIVSGAYGHSRMREWLFGGATRDLLEVSRACLFMSH